MLCMSCGTTINENVVRFCPKCGKPVLSGQLVQPVQPAPQIPVPQKKKFWAILIVLLLAVVFAGAGFGVYLWKFTPYARITTALEEKDMDTVQKLYPRIKNEDQLAEVNRQIRVYGKSLVMKYQQGELDQKKFDKEFSDYSKLIEGNKKLTAKFEKMDASMLEYIRNAANIACSIEAVYLEFHDDLDGYAVIKMADGDLKLYRRNGAEVYGGGKLLEEVHKAIPEAFFYTKKYQESASVIIVYDPNDESIRITSSVD